MVGHLEQHTEDSSADSATEGSNHPSDSEMESDYDWESHHHSDPSSDHSSVSDDNSGSESGSSDDNGGDFADMFKGKLRHSNTPKKPGHWKHSEPPERPESWPSSSNRSRSREPKNQKRRHIASPDNMPNPDKPDRKKKKSDQRETPLKAIPGEDTRVNVPMTGQPIDLGRSWPRNMRMRMGRGNPGQRSPRRVPPAGRRPQQPGTHPRRMNVKEKGREKKRKLKPGKPSSGQREKEGKKKIKNSPGRNYSTNTGGKNTAMSAWSSRSTGENTSHWSKWSPSTWTTTPPT